MLNVILVLSLLWVFLTAFHINEVIAFQIPPLITIPSDTFLNVTELITSKGYPVENHVVKTDDGYLLSVQRIPYGRKQSKNVGKRPAVLLIHALLFTGSQWVWNSPEQSLGFILADSGYDVWIANSRGSTYSRRHVRLSTNSHEFWDFSFEDMAKYDVPAMIDYILKTTQEEKLSLIGHSRGTTMGFILLSESQKYNNKIKIFITLAPAGSIAGLKGVLAVVGSFEPFIEAFFKAVGYFELFPSNYFTRLFSLFCGTPGRFICAELFFSSYGYDRKQLNYTRLPVYYANTPAGSSTKDIVHYGQTIVSKKFRKYDYDEDNQRRYNQKTPPEFDISKITTPVALISGENDFICNPTIVGRLRKDLKTVVFDYVVPGFNHVDFSMAIDANKLVYNRIISLLEKYNN